MRNMGHISKFRLFKTDPRFPSSHVQSIVPEKFTFSKSGHFVEV